MEIQYPYVPVGRSFKYVSDTDPFMKEAKRLRDTESSDSKIPTGSVVVKDGIVVGRAANKSRIKHKSLLALHSRFCVRRILRVPTGKAYFLCPGCANFRQHSESRAVRDAIRKGADTKGADLYLYGHWWCCKSCWDVMLKAGIRDVYLLKGSECLFNHKHRESILG